MPSFENHKLSAYVAKDFLWKVERNFDLCGVFAEKRDIRMMCMHLFSYFQHKSSRSVGNVVIFV